MKPQPTDHQDAKISAQARAQIAAHCALGGLCPLIPLPFVDDMLIKRVHKRMIRKLCAQHHIHFKDGEDDDALELLIAKESSLLSSAAKAVLWWPVKKVLRKLILVWAVKGCADVAATLYYEGWMLARTLEQGYVDLEPLRAKDKQALKRVRDAILDAHEAVDPSLIRQSMRSVFGVSQELLTSSASALKATFKQDNKPEALDQAQQELKPLTARIEQEIERSWSDDEALDQALKRSLDDKAQAA